MTNSILQELFNGRVFPSENIIPKDPRYHEIHREIDNIKEHFNETLSEKERKHFDDLMDLCTEAATIYDCECFTHGFRLAVTLMAEGIRNTDDLFRND